MNGIKWVNKGTRRLPWYVAEIGCVGLCCRQEIITHASKNRRIRKEWGFSVDFGNKWIAVTKTRKSLQLAKEDAEKLGIKYLFSCGFIALSGLKNVGLLEELLSEVGVDL